MKEIIIITPDAEELSENFIASLAHVVAAELDTSVENIVIHQWDTETKESTDSPTIDAVLGRTVNTLSPYLSTDTKTTENNLCFALLTNHGDEHELLVNAIKVIATYDKPARLPSFGIRQYGINACKSVYSRIS
jgi:hypothetical protein